MPRREATRRATIRVDLLGSLEVRTARGAPISLGGRHAPALFALLVLARRPRSREAIAADLWPEADATSAAMLRQALWLVRHGLARVGIDPVSILDIRPESIGIRPDASLDVDVEAFESCLDRPDCGAERAVELYRGDLVESLGHDCFAAERERLADRYEDALVTVAQQALAQGDLSRARRVAEQAIARDPIREEAHAVLITVLGLIGSRSQVVRQYRRLEAVLSHELGEPPLAETVAAYRQAMRDVVSRSMEQVALASLDHRPALVAVGP